MATYSIKDLEKLSGIKAHTLRIWEKRYSLVEPKRTDTNIRYYDDKKKKKILNVALLNRKGLKISQLAQLDEREINSKINDLTNGDSDNESVIDNLIISMIDLDEKKFEKILSLSIMRDGFETTLINTIHPFFEKIGVLWLTGAINPAQEHFISNLVRQKLIVAIDNLMEDHRPDSKNFILYLPEGELHELGLLFYYYLLKKRGHSVTYLGQSVPFGDIHTIVKVRPCDYIFTSFGSSITGIDVENYIQKLSGSFPSQEILFSVYEGGEIGHNLPLNVKMVRNATDLQLFLNDIEADQTA